MSSSLHLFNFLLPSLPHQLAYVLALSCEPVDIKLGCAGLRERESERERGKKRALSCRSFRFVLLVSPPLLVMGGVSGSIFSSDSVLSIVNFGG